MQIIECTICSKSFPKMEILYVHMKLVHEESDDLRITRHTQTFQAVVSKAQHISEENHVKESQIFGCSECGLIFSTLEGQIMHNNNQHCDNKVIRSDICDQNMESRELLKKHTIENHSNQEEISTLNIKSEDYDIKAYPENKETKEDILLNNIFGGQKKVMDHEGLTMQGKIIAFKNACITIKSKLSKGTILKDKEGRQKKYSTKRLTVHYK